jgi:hypothetical protein
MSSYKWLPILLILLGGAVLLTMVIFSIFGFPQPNQKTDLALPPQLGGYSLSKQITGIAAVSEFTELHGKNLAIQGGVKGIYGEWGVATVWVAVAQTENAAWQLMTDMEAKIAEGRSPFTIQTPMVVNGRTINVLDGMDQSHFYFLSGKALIWLAANPTIAGQALQDALNFYP